MYLCTYKTLDHTAHQLHCLLLFATVTMVVFTVTMTVFTQWITMMTSIVNSSTAAVMCNTPIKCYQSNSYSIMRLAVLKKIFSNIITMPWWLYYLICTCCTCPSNSQGQKIIKYLMQGNNCMIVMSLSI